MHFGRSGRKSEGSRSRDVGFAEAISSRLALNIKEVSPSI